MLIIMFRMDFRLLKMRLENICNFCPSEFSLCDDLSIKSFRLKISSVFLILSNYLLLF